MRSIPFLFVLAVCVGLSGCGEPEEPVTMFHDNYLNVIDHEGQQEAVPADEIVDQETGEPRVQSVWVIDRRTNEKTWISVEELVNAPPSMSRYQPVMQAEADAISNRPPAPAQEKTSD
ncbi:MAG: hypothetical protein ACQESR_20810 [Planctomycetota bacterium]